jgi:Mg/Co/Ni transporter MgtE
MNSFNALSLGFLASRPHAAASVLQGLNTAQAAGYLDAIPVRTLAPVLQNMETWPAARILDCLPLEKNVAILTQLSYQSVAALLRLQTDERRTALLLALPDKLARPLTLSLTYQESTVGAWMDMSTPHFFEDLSAWECLALLKKIKHPVGCSLPVINKKHHIVGVVTLDVLVTSADEKELGKLMDVNVAALPAEMSLKQAKHSCDWDRHTVLPVRSGSGTYLGTLNRSTLRVASHDHAATQDSLPADSLLAHMGAAMLTSASGLLGLSGDSAGDPRHGD